MGCERPNYNIRLEKKQVDKLLKIMLKVAEAIGSIVKVTLDNNYYCGDYIDIHGKTKDGRNFFLELRVKDDANS